MSFLSSVGNGNGDADDEYLPRWVKTEMGQGLADAVGFEAGPPLGVGESAKGVVEQVCYP